MNREGAKAKVTVIPANSVTVSHGRLPGCWPTSSVLTGINGLGQELYGLIGQIDNWLRHH